MDTENTIASLYKNNVNPKKHFGQNFLKDEKVISNIVRALCVKKGDNLVEIGAGYGALTVQILPELGFMNAIELDHDLIPILRSNCKNLGRIDIHQTDVLSFDFKKIAGNRRGNNSGSLRIAGNLPYNISTPLLFRLIDYIPFIKDMHFMLQKEVGERLISEKGNKRYGRMSVVLQYFFDVTALFDVPPDSFYPKPKVHSIFLRFVPKKKKSVYAKDVASFIDTVRLSFGQKRKTIKNNLKKIITQKEIKNLNIDPSLRPEDISTDDFVRISNRILELNEKQAP